MPLPKVTGFNQHPNELQLQNTVNVTHVDFSAFTRDDKVKKNINRAGSIPNHSAVVEARRIKRDHNIAANKTGNSHVFKTQHSGGPTK